MADQQQGLPGATGQGIQLKIKKGGMLGAILVENGFITHEQLLKCLELQAKSQSPVPFGKIAVEQGFVTEEIVNLVLDAQRKYVAEVQEEQVVSTPPAASFVQEVDKQPFEARSLKDTLLSWLAAARDHRASDLHVMAGKPLVLRHQKRLFESREKALSENEAEELLLSILTDQEQSALKERGAVVKCIDLPGGGRARTNVFRYQGGLSGVFRLIPAAIPSLVSLNLPAVLGKFTTYKQGLIILSGPIGSGKTTTMASLIDVINHDRSLHIISIEDPIEFVFESKRSLVTQRQIGTHTKTLADGLKSALRDDPDILVVGELADLETARLALSAAEIGHVVLATMCTQNTLRAISKLIDIFPADEQVQVRSILSESLRGIVSQHLVPRVKAHGLVPITEVLVATEPLRNLIHAQKEQQLRSAMEMHRDAGNIALSEHAEILWRQGAIDEQTYSRFAKK